MDDLISRQDAIDALWKALHEYEDKTEKQFQESDELDVGDWIQHRIFVQNMSDIDRQTILALPSEAEPIRHGHWVDDGERYGLDHKLAMWECDQCGETIWAYLKDPRRWNYCPNCGAKMDEVTE